MLDARFSHLYFYQSLNRLQRGLSAIAELLVTKEDGILIKILRQSKGYSAGKLLEEFPDKDWSCSALDRLLRQIDATEFADRKSGSSRERTVCTRNM